MKLTAEDTENTETDRKGTGVRIRIRKPLPSGLCVLRVLCGEYPDP
jgi:hypothetical protein